MESKCPYPHGRLASVDTDVAPRPGAGASPTSRVASRPGAGASQANSVASRPGAGTRPPGAGTSAREGSLSGLPAGPRSRLRSGLAFMRNPAGFYRSCTQRYGDTFTVRGPDGTVVTTADPELAQVIFRARHDQLGASVDLTEPALGPGSVFLLSGEEARREREVLAMAFARRRTARYADMMWNVAERHSREWPTDRPVLMRPALNAISLEIIVRCIFGVTEHEEVARCAALVDQYVDTFFAPMLYFEPLRGRWFRPWNRFVAAREALRGFLRGEVRACRRSSRNGGDILSLLVEARYDDGSALDDEQIIDELVTLLLAGHETTSIGMTWALYWLERTPGAARRTLDELRPLGRDPDTAAVASLPWLDAVCKESLRLHPIASRVTRQVLDTPFELGPWTIPVGLAVGVSITAIHERADLYAAPGEFRPGRFLERRYGAHEYLPFGGGIRRCPGSGFADVEMRVVLACVLQRFRIRAASAAPARPVRRSVTMAPKGDVPMWLERR